MLKILKKSQVWSYLDQNVHSELQWKNSEIHLKTWQDIAVYDRIRNSKALRIAEIGGGNSRILRKMSQDNDCVNVDKLEGQDGGPKGVQNIPNIQTVRVFLGEFSSLLPDCSFDIVYSVSVIEHVPAPMTTPFLDDMLRIMKPGALSIHAIDLYLSEEEIPQSRNRLAVYKGWLSHQDVEPLGPIEVERAVFTSDMATNPDLTMWHWNRVAPALKSLRETSQSTSLLLGFRKKG